MKDSNEISPSNPWKILYTYWATIPTRKNIDILTADKIRNQPVRYFLLDYIHQGKEDEYSKRNNLRRRHAFSAHELYIAYKDEVLGEQEHKFTIQNIHFHLKKLLETDLIYIVTSIVEGNHRIKYYGQTAKITLLNQKSSELLKREQKMTIEPFTKLLVKLNPSVSEQQIVDMLTETFELRANLKQSVVFAWLEENHDLIYDSNIDFTHLSLHLNSLLTIESRILKLLKKQAQMFKLPIDIN